MHLISGLLLIGVLSCSADSPDRRVSKAGAPAIGPKVGQLWIDSRRTTEPDVAVRNFQGQVEAFRARVVEDPDNLVKKRRLAAQLLARIPFLGTFDDFDEADVLTTLGEEPDADALMARAGFLSAVHRFAEARALLERAQALGAPENAVERSRIVIALAVGDDPATLVPRAEALAEASAVYGTLTVLGSVYAGAGRFDDADAAYQRALEAYRDVSPFTLAWVSFTRGVMWGEAADRADLAEVLYRDAIRRLPMYVVANVHLSELADDAEAVRLLESVLDSEDPEPAARLSQRVDGERRTQLVGRARARFEQLLSRHRHAFLDHGAEFFVIAGEPERALELARENVELRGNPRAYVVAIGAAAEAEEQAELCELVRRARPLALRHPVLAASIEDEGGGCD